MKVDTFACDICKAIKRDTNHWWLGYSWEGATSVQVISWDDSKAKDQDARPTHLCGVECATKFVARELAK